MFILRAKLKQGRKVIKKNSQVFKGIIFKGNQTSYLVVPFVIASSLILIVCVKSQSKKVKKQTGSKTQGKVTCWKTVYNVRRLLSIVYLSFCLCA